MRGWLLFIASLAIAWLGYQPGLLDLCDRRLKQKASIPLIGSACVGGRGWAMVRQRPATTPQRPQPLPVDAHALTR